MSVPPKNNLSLELPTGSVELSTSLPKQNTGSSTGNPRNKCALKPGHSLMDWIRLGNSGCDLSGTKGAIIPAGIQELRKHSSKKDAWMAIRGKVYNVTKYMDFHPGGTEELMRGVGTDATKLFDQVHPWVNYEQLLKKCFIGPLEYVVPINTDCFKAIKNINPVKSSKVSSIEATTGTFLKTNVNVRFDWIQKLSDVTLYFYTKKFCNPGLVLTKKDGRSMCLRLCIANCWYRHSLELHKEVNWPPTNINVSRESGRIEIVFHKTYPNIWQTCGNLNNSTDQENYDCDYEFIIQQIKNFNHNSFALLLRGIDSIIVMPVGHHLTFCCEIENQKVRRNYTPIPKKFSPININHNMDLHFLLKTYENGFLPNYLLKLECKSTLYLSEPKGSLSLDNFLGHTKIALLAAGSGITPMLGLIDHLLSRNIQKIEKLLLMNFNKTEEDIWCRKPLEELMASDKRLKIKNVLSQPFDHPKTDTEKGHITEELLSNLNNPFSEDYCSFYCVCGTSTFNTKTESLLQAINVDHKNIFFFNN